MSDFWSFDTANETWRKIQPLGVPMVPRFGHNAAYDVPNNRLMIMLGQGDSEFFDDVWAYYPDTNGFATQSATEPRPDPRYGAGAAMDTAGFRMLVTHGFTTTGRFDDTWTFDLLNANWAQIRVGDTRPVQRCLARSHWLRIEKQLLLFGGQTDGTPFLGDFWALDANRGMWTENTGTLPGPRNLYAADATPDRWIIFGGNTPDGPAGDVWAYDIADDVWSELRPGSDPPSGRYGTDAAIAQGRMYVFGGHDGSGPLDELWALDGV